MDPLLPQRKTETKFAVQPKEGRLLVFKDKCNKPYDGIYKGNKGELKYTKQSIAY